MKRELEERVIRECPRLYKDSTGRYECRFECGDGWYELILEISRLLEAETVGPPPRRVMVGIVKEKFGTLRFGYGGEV
jgi:hypothetical protein